MADKRMINQKISLSEKLAELGEKEALIYTWMIPHADDFSLLPGSPKTIKYKVVPMMESITLEDVGFQLESMRKLGLIKQIQQGDKMFYYIVGNREEQTLKKDRQPKSLLTLEYDKDVKKSWDKAEKLLMELLGNQLEDTGIQTEDSGNNLESKRIQLDTELNRTELNRTELIIGAERPEVKTEKPEDPGPSIQGTQKPVPSEKTENPPPPDVPKDSEKPKGMETPGDSLRKKYGFTPPPASGNVSRGWQDKALRYAEALGIDLNYVPDDAKEPIRSRWMKVFRDADEKKIRPANIEKAYSYLIDKEGLGNEGKIRYFFWIYNNGLPGGGRNV